MKNQYYMNMLAKLASSNVKIAGARIAACVVHKKTIVSFGVNQMKSHPFQAKYGIHVHSDAIFLHAETAAIKNALRCLSIEELAECSLYICRVKMIKGKFVWGLAKPCVGCSRAIAEFGIKNVIYSNENNVLEIF